MILATPQCTFNMADMPTASENRLHNLKKNYKRKTYRRSQQNTHKEIEYTAKPGKVFDISYMESSTYYSTNLPAEVTEWQKHDQIAYWKSRAISLELENRMLYDHLRNVYGKTIEEYAQYNSSHNSSSRECQKQILMDTEYRETVNNAKEKNDLKRRIPVSAKEPEGKNRIEEMKKIYGDMAPKIMGMETALQLNYERHTDESKPPYWPSLPLRFTFNSNK